MLSLHAVSKEYNMIPIIDDVSLRFENGTSYVLTAPNGSGKTTLLQVMAGLSRPTRGRVLWEDKPFLPKHRKSIGVVLQQPFLYGDLSAMENLTLYATLYGCKDAHQRAERWVKRVGLSDAHNQSVKNYSKGMKQRLSIARALIHDPKLILLDEPFDGLDAAFKEKARALFREKVAGGAALFMVTHQVDDAEDEDVRFTLRFGRLVGVH